MSSNTIAPSRIIGIQFGMLSPEEIERNAVVEIKTRDTYVNNKPLPEGLFDPRMGVLEPGLVCPTDGLTYIDNPGYFGCIKLAKPVLFIQHIKDIMKIAKCVCFKCSRLLINKNQHKHILSYPLEKRWDYVAPLATKVRRCGEAIDDGCGCKQPDKIKLEGFEKIYAVWASIATDQPDGSKQANTVNMRLTPEILLKIFHRISDEDISFMGFSPVWSRPEWMICQVLPVPPPAVRPSVKLDAQQRSEDDLTHIYANIIKTNKDLFDKLQKPDTTAVVIEGLTSVLQYFIAMIVNNKIKGAVPMAQRSGRPLQCIMGRLNSKNGRIRGNLMGKRVNFSARSVITGDPNLSVRQLGVPMKIAKNLTKPIVVNEKNRDFLMRLIQNGPDVHPGAKIVERKNGESISLRYADVNSIHLDDGDIVHRHMMDGDAVLFNRQPSLHRMSMMCHIVKIMKQGDSFRFNVGCTKPYNADFDGDEMNMHLPQNVLAETELRHLAAIPYQMLSPVGPSPVIGIYQDSLLGSFRFTRPNITLTPRDAMNLLMAFPRVNVRKLEENKDHLTSFDVLSQILPELSLKYKKDDNVMEIRNGEYLSGQLEKSMLGASTKGILHRIFNDFGPFAATDFVDDLQNIITEYMKTSSFSVGISDLIANKTTQDRIVQIITEKKSEVQSELDKLHLGIFENDTSQSNMVHFETTVNNILNKATDLSGKEGRKSLNKSNRFLMIVESGSKGSLVNISQMISCLGQTNVDGKRISYGFDDRTLPHFKKFDDSPGARGFIENSYISGLTAPELFFHAMGGRIGLIDTAVKTSSTGYIQRRLIKGLEDLKVEYDMTVRNNRGKIIQFAYGDDGVDSTKVESQALPLVNMSVEDVYMHYDIAGVSQDLKEGTSLYTKGTATRLRKQRPDTVKKINEYIERMIHVRDMLVSNVFAFKNDSSVKVPVAFQHVIANLQGQLGLNSHSTTDITPLEAFELIEHTFEKIRKLHFAPPTKLFEVLYYFYLTPRELLVHKRFHRKGLELLLETVVLKYKQSLVHPGEMVGVIAGQSIGEPTTQLTLNSVTYETELLVRNGKGEMKKVQIGDFVTENIRLSSKLEYMEDKDTTYAELSADTDFYEIPSATEDGRTLWTRIEAVTQHPVVNEDGTNTMLKITTEAGREVIVTKAKSILQLVEGKIVPVLGKDLAVGDYAPVSLKTVECVAEYEQSGAADLLSLGAMVPNKKSGVIVFEPRGDALPDMLFDKIVAITEVANTTNYAYDLTVEITRNFDCYNGLCCVDTFHLAGVASKSNVTRGVPRIEEILRLTDNPKKPALTIHLKPVDETDKDRANVYANMLEHTVLKDVVKSVQICFDPLERSTVIETDRTLVEEYYAFEDLMRECQEDGYGEPIAKSKWIVRMEMDAELLLEKNITMDDIHFAIKNTNPDIQCIYTDYNDSHLVFRIRMNGDSFKKKKGTIQSLDQSDEIYLLKNFQDGLLQNIVLRGIYGIENVLPRKLQNMVVKEDGKFVRKDTWVLDTTGTNLLDVLATDYIDAERTYSNDISEVFDVLGIEAARQIIYNEFAEVMEFSDVFINYHHLSLLCDRMTVTKNMVAIFRSGLHNDDIGPIAKATFEVHTEILLNAARHADFDEMRGVSANVMCGQFGYYGTGAFNVLLDMKEIAKVEAEDALIRNDKKDIDALFKQKDQDACVFIQNNISAIYQENEGVCKDEYDMGF